MPADRDRRKTSDKAGNRGPAPAPRACAARFAGQRAHGGALRRWRRPACPHAVGPAAVRTATRQARPVEPPSALRCGDRTLLRSGPCHHRAFHRPGARGDPRGVAVPPRMPAALGTESAGCPRDVRARTAALQPARRGLFRSGRGALPVNWWRALPAIARHGCAGASAARGSVCPMRACDPVQVSPPSPSPTTGTGKSRPQPRSPRRRGAVEPNLAARAGDCGRVREARSAEDAPEQRGRARAEEAGRERDRGGAHGAAAAGCSSATRGQSGTPSGGTVFTVAVSPGWTWMTGRIDLPSSFGVMRSVAPRAVASGNLADPMIREAAFSAAPRITAMPTRRGRRPRRSRRPRPGRHCAPRLCPSAPRSP